MFLNFYDKNEKIKKSIKDVTFNDFYNYWQNMLLQRSMRLFVWHNTSIEQKELESALLLNGHGLVTMYNGKLAVFMGNMNGKPTIYYDEFEEYAIHSPIYSKVLTIKDNKDGVLISNNSIRNALFPLINHYAMLLSHVELTYINTLINGRDASGVPVVQNEAQRQSVINYRNNLRDGKVTSISDPAFLGVEFHGLKNSTAISIIDIQEARDNILNNFYADLGVKTTWNKKGNMIREEVNGNDAMLLMNISDMLANRKLACEAINSKYGTKWQVELAPELQYTTEGGNNDV